WRARFGRAGASRAVSARRIDSAWALFFGLSPHAFLLPGIQVVAHHGLAEYQGAWLFRHQSSLCLSVSSDAVEAVRIAVQAHTMESLFSEPGIRALFGSRVKEIVGPAYQGYVERPQFRSAPHPGVRALSPADEAALHQLADASGTSAWERSGITFDDRHLFGCFVDDRLIAAARYREAWAKTPHIGVVTHPAYRQRRYGRAVV